MNAKSQLPHLVESHESEILQAWIKDQLAAVSRKDLLKESELREQSGTFLRAFRDLLQGAGNSADESKAWAQARQVLTTISSERAKLGFGPTETATFIYSLKPHLFRVLRQEMSRMPDVLVEEIDRASTVLDGLGLYTNEVYQKAREDVIRRQQQEMLELSTPVIKLWDGVLCLPMIGTLDSQRSQIVMENLLQSIADSGADVAIIDITGVPAVDTLTAQHLLKTISAARLMGAECILSGIRPQIAQTIVHLGIDLQKVQTKASLADALVLALHRRGFGVRPLREATGQER